MTGRNDDRQQSSYLQTQRNAGYEVVRVIAPSVSPWFCSQFPGPPGQQLWVSASLTRPKALALFAHSPTRRAQRHLSPRSLGAGIGWDAIEHGAVNMAWSLWRDYCLNPPALALVEGGEETGRLAEPRIIDMRVTTTEMEQRLAASGGKLNCERQAVESLGSLGELHLIFGCRVEVRLEGRSAPNEGCS